MKVPVISTVSLADVLQRDNNNFDLLRLLAALGVIFGHSFALFPIDYGAQFLGLIGRLCVSIFFFISGIFVTASYVNSPSHLRFVLMRVGRIWPALIVCLLLTTFILGPLVTTYDVQTYLAHPATLLYLTTNFKLSTIDYRLPGVFEHVYYPAVNGSLWTLPAEIRCYVFVFMAGLLGTLADRKKASLTCLTVVMLWVYYRGSIIYFDGMAAHHASFFLLGIFCYFNRARIRLDWKIAAGLFVCWALFRDTLHGDRLFFLFVMYATLVFAAAKPMRRIRLPGDYSYGVYLYGFVVQETVAFYSPGMKSCASMLLTIPISLMLGIASWHLVEKRCIQAANRLSAALPRCGDWALGEMTRLFQLGKRQAKPPPNSELSLDFALPNDGFQET